MSTETIEKTPRPTRVQVESTENIKEILHNQKTYKVRLRGTPGVNDINKETAVPVSINGHRYTIKRRHMVEVPESIYLVLVQAGEIEPQEPEHEVYMPVSTVKTSDELLAEKAGR